MTRIREHSITSYALDDRNYLYSIERIDEKRHIQFSGRIKSFLFLNRSQPRAFLQLDLCLFLETFRGSAMKNVF